MVQPQHGRMISARWVRSIEISIGSIIRRGVLNDGARLFEIDRELDTLLDAIEEQTEENGTAAPGFWDRFRQSCDQPTTRSTGLDHS
jgi:hypothetical protein